ncbi:MAG: TIGR01212 family radical SAM protein [Bacteriovoracaceae bacterium]|nr:TIGR01212 family radical SAM protein [Bacteriovoracaceae bacterium]
MNNPLNLYSRYIKTTYGQRVQKIPIDGGFTCPNRDGSKGYGGCTFCNNDSFSMGVKEHSIKTQVYNGIELYRRRFPDLQKFIVYFQSYSNTYKDVKELERIYLEALSIEGVIGIAIGTRPDCIDKEKIALLQNLAQHYEVTVEYGVESLSDETLRRVNRGHSVKDFESALDMTYGRGIKLCTHLILGFPWETEDDLKKTCHRIKKYPLDFIKIHQLQVIKGTIMGAEFEKNPFKVIGKEEYFKMLMEIISHLDPKIVIQRLFSDYHRDYLISGPWPQSLSQLTSEFISYLQSSRSFQGKNFF